MKDINGFVRQGIGLFLISIVGIIILLCLGDLSDPDLKGSVVLLVIAAIIFGGGTLLVYNVTKDDDNDNGDIEI